MKFPAIPVSDIIVFEEMQISLMVVSSALFPLVTKIKEDKHPVVLLFRKGNIQASQSIEDFDYHTTSALVQIQDVFLE
ncbi:MAG: hypothetical protein U9Q15_05195 [Patescibacteria group bacterium]|nr:hypothetical protein [Patescibacteria group bacterium]